MAPSFVAGKSISARKREDWKGPHTRSKGFYDFVNIFGFYTVDDVVARSGDEMTIRHNVNIRLINSQPEISYQIYTIPILLFHQTPPPTEDIYPVYHKH